MINVRKLNYMVIVVRENGKWGVAYGSYDIDDIQSEMSDLRSKYQPRDMKRFYCSGIQKEIDNIIADMNEVGE